MSDFEYDQRDVAALHSAFLTLNQDENQAFKLAGATFLLSCVTVPFILRVRPRGIFFYSLFSSSIVYNLWTYQSRAIYKDTAYMANKRASLQINKLMEY